MRAIDFFCGAGGLTHGLSRAGIEVVAGVDVDEHCGQSFVRNNRDTQFLCSDISEVAPDALWRILGSRRTSDLLLAGCAPCQPFSKQRKYPVIDGTRLKRASLAETRLLSCFARLVEVLRPGYVLVENVPGMARVPGRSSLQRFTAMLKENGYGVAQGILDAKHYEVPQTRRRYVLLAVKGRAASLPTALLGTSQAVTVRQAIAHFPSIAAGEAHYSVPNHTAAALSPVNLERIRATPPDGGDRRQWGEELKLSCHTSGYEGHTDVYGRMRWDAPAPTLTGRCNSLSNGRYGHPEQDRAISLREAASLQTFPDSYIFHGSNQSVARQIGNAVPVLFAQALANHLLTLKDEK
jgi:DNA (cytosine-5)-methyltransferase 1